MMLSEVPRDIIVWVQALPDLLKYWSEHGFGLVAKHSALQWSGSSGGALTAAAVSFDSTGELQWTINIPTQRTPQDYHATGH